MSARLAIVAVILALVLGVALALLQRGPGPSPGGGGAGSAAQEELAAFDAGRVVTMEVEREGQPVVTVQRAAAGGWSLVMRDAAAWPVVPENPINLLRGLRTLKGQRPGVEGIGADGVPPNAVKLTLRSDHGEVTRFAFDPAPVAGRLRAWANDRGPYLVGDEILIALTDPGPVGWRIPRVFPGFNEFTASRVELETDEDPPLVLVRLMGRWHMDKPVRAGADQQAVGELLRVIASLPVSRFMAATEALVRRSETEPAWRIEVKGREEAAAAELTIWGALEPSGSILLAAVAAGDGLRTFLAIPADALGSLRVLPRLYLSQVASEQAVGDVARVVVYSADLSRSVLFERDLARWMVSVDGGAARPDAENAAEALLALLTGGSAQAVMFPAGPAVAVPTAMDAAGLAVPADFVLDAIVELRSMDDGVLEVIRLGRSSAGGEVSGDGGVLTALRGQARWDYTEAKGLLRAVRMLEPAAGLPGLD